MKRLIQIEKEFMNLTIRISEEEQVRLERSLMHESCREPISVWHGVILDGHKRYKFCSYEEIEFDIREMDFASHDEAVIWLCSERLKELNAYSPMYRYLTGKWYNCQKRLKEEYRKEGGKEEQNPEYAKNKRNSFWDTSSTIGEKLGISRATVERAGKFADVMDRLSDVEPALFEAILRKEILFTQAEVLSMADMSKKQIGDIRRKKLGKKDVKMRSRNNKEICQDCEKEKKTEDEIHIKTGIKEMPPFDPDMEIRGLALTVPTWINVLAKTEKKMDTSQATNNAKEQLVANLCCLKEQVNRILEVLK